MGSGHQLQRRGGKNEAQRMAALQSGPINSLSASPEIRMLPRPRPATLSAIASTRNAGSPPNEVANQVQQGLVNGSTYLEITKPFCMPRGLPAAILFAGLAGQRKMLAELLTSLAEHEFVIAYRIEKRRGGTLVQEETRRCVMPAQSRAAPATLAHRARAPPYALELEPIMS